MKIRTLIFGIVIVFTSCKKIDNKIDNKKFNHDINTKEKTDYLTYEQFKNSKWIIGEVGLNGENPDTIIFDNPKTLSYINSDTGEEKCKYLFVKDTLIFISYFTEFDTETDNETIFESINKLHYQNNSFKYIYSLYKKSSEKAFKRNDLEKHNLVFRRI